MLKEMFDYSYSDYVAADMLIMRSHQGKLTHFSFDNMKKQVMPSSLNLITFIIVMTTTNETYGAIFISLFI